MRTILISAILAALWLTPASACAPDSVDITKAAIGDKYQREDGRWERRYGYLVTCEDDTLDTRIYPMRWPGSEATADSALEARANQMRVDLLRYYRMELVDWDAKITRATEMLADDDIRPSLSAVIDSIGTLDNPNVGQMANAWRTIFGRLTWVQTTEQADSLLYRIADSFEMTGVGMLNYIKANKEWLE